MNIKEIKSEIDKLAIRHQDDDEDFELWEDSAQDLIIEYCEEKGYQVEGFPQEMKESDDEKYDEDYFTVDRYYKYIETLVVSNDDVADLQWYFVDRFWPDNYSSKAHFIEDAKASVQDGPSSAIKF